MHIPRIGDLELEQDVEFQRREWRFERIGWVVMALVIAAACLGLFGGAGLFLKTTIGEPGSLLLEYERFARFKAPSVLRVQVGSVPGDTVRLWMERSYVRSYSIDQITPAPEGAEARADGVVFVFVRADTAAPFEVTFNLTAEKIGGISGGVRLLTRGDLLQFSQFVYP